MTILETIADAITPAREDPRLEARRDVRRQIAAVERDMARRLAAIAKLDEFDGRKKTAAAEHAATCAPLIAERDAIEARANSLQADRQPVDPADEARLTELAKLIDAANEQLSLTCAALDLERKRIAKAFGNDVNRGHIGKLSGEKSVLLQRLRGDLANPRLLARHRGLKHLVTHLRTAAAAAAAGHLGGGALGGGTYHTSDRQRIAEASDVADEWLADALREFDQVFQDLLDE